VATATMLQPDGGKSAESLPSRMGTKLAAPIVQADETPLPFSFESKLVQVYADRRGLLRVPVEQAGDVAVAIRQVARRAQSMCSNRSNGPAASPVLGHRAF